MFVAYYRVSTHKQGRSGLGLDAQRQAVADYVAKKGGALIEEFTEIETGKGANALDRRPELRAALEACRKQKATLLIAKLDRLARNVRFVADLLESAVDFVAVDMPEANKTMIQIHSVMAEWERDQISKRTKDALAAAKLRGVRLGVAGPRNLQSKNAERRGEATEFADRLRKQIHRFEDEGLSQRQMVAELNRVGVPTRNGKPWRLIQLQRVLKRLRHPVDIASTGPDVGSWGK